jgi:phosphate starvation-inducible membrane PsiE
MSTIAARTALWAVTGSVIRLVIISEEKPTISEVWIAVSLLIMVIQPG